MPLVSLAYMRNYNKRNSDRSKELSKLKEQLDMEECVLQTEILRNKIEQLTTDCNVIETNKNLRIQPTYECSTPQQSRSVMCGCYNPKRRRNGKKISSHPPIDYNCVLVIPNRQSMDLSAMPFPQIHENFENESISSDHSIDVGATWEYKKPLLLRGNSVESGQNSSEGISCDNSSIGAASVDGDIMFFPLPIKEDAYYLQNPHCEILYHLDTRPPSLLSEDTGVQTDDEEEQVPCAISQRWHYDESNRWSRNNDESNHEFTDLLDANIGKQEVYQRSASIDTASSMTSLSVEAAKKHVKDNHSDGTPSTASSNKLKIKSSILKRVGGDLKKLRTPSFRRNVKSDGTKKRDKSREMVIGEPQLQTGHEKLDQFRCIPIGEKNNDVLMSLQQQHFNTRYSRPRKNSSQSLTSTSSSSAGGSSAASTPATRPRSFRDKKSSHHRGRSVDAVLRDPTSPILLNNKQLLKKQAANGVYRLAPTPVNPEEKVFLVSKTHTPGTFPTIMAEVSEMDNQNSSEDGESPLPNPKPQRRRPHKVKQRSVSDFVSNQHRQHRPVSIYDNITDNKLHPAASAQDLLDILTPPSPGGSDVDGDAPLPVQSSDAFWSVDDIMKQTESLKQQVHLWEDDENEAINRRRRQHSVDISAHHTSEESRTVSPLSASNENLYESQEGLNQLQDDHRHAHVSRAQWLGHRQPLTSLSSEPLQLHNLSVGQLMILSRLSVLKLTATMEKYTPVTNGSKSNNLSWTVPRFIRRTKVPAYKDRDVFSVPLVHNVQKYGHPIPHCILNAMAYIHNEALDQVGLFRKSGVKSRIQKIRNMCEADPDLHDFENIEDVNAYDVADMIKQYFRDLPDHIMTAKLSETFTGIFLHVPSHLRLQSLHAAIMLLPDENREALKTLLCFLKTIANRSDENQMNESNLAVCFAPSIFYQNTSYSLSTSSPKGRKASRHGAGLALGKSDMKEMSENNAANLCLAFMIQKVNELFTIPEDAMTQCRLSVMQQTQDVVATELGYPMVDSHDQAEFLRDYHSYVNKVVSQTVREEQRLSHNKTSGWNFVSSENGTEICYKKMNDGNPLRLWRCKVEIEGATVEQVLKRIREERHLWDDNLIEGRVLERFDDKTECYQCLREQMRPHPPREYCVMRSWKSNVSPRNLTVMVETSTDHPNAPILDGVRGVVLTSQYVLESVVSQSSSSDYTSSNSSLSSSGTQMQKCILTRLCRVDTKGRNPEWYNKAFGHIALRGLAKVRDSFRLQNNNNFIHTKIKESK